ncbi:envelope stress response membrane protein PspB [Sphingosinicella sp. LHD-64]|uniref:envelope stress response membrane protein PspB n=1 Tax=Sphingosinicella sp. LHD-64 TaxID=3072139 RepID=UPI00280FD213|nr:envelope stress response membrane protein PspB [Sphingosinicella sp. LHD-64]MDQ8755595.1 envelope stress response membrane protein PspB [Sphingosinicella sp. LHD-64]
MEDVLVPILVCGMLFVGLPWIILHYVSKWKTSATLTTEDENLLDELHDLARRLDERMMTIERIVQADNPNWRSVAYDPVEDALEDRSERLLGQRTNRATSRRN